MSDDAVTIVAKTGNLARSPELTVSQRGTSVCRFGLAVTPYVPKGQPEPETTFYEIVCFGSLADNAAESLLKGDRALVIGRGEVEHWTDKTGAARTTKKILADSCGSDLRFVPALLQRSERRWPAQQ